MTSNLSKVAALVLSALLCAGQALAQTTPAPAPAGGTAPAELPRQPFLQIETGFHTAPVNAVALAAKAPVLVTASADKTVRVWNADRGALLSTIRVPLAPGLEGSIRAVTVSPDGKNIVAAGYTTGLVGSLCLYMIDTDRAEITKTVKIPGLASAVAFAPGGDKFAIAMQKPSPTATTKPGVALLSSAGDLVRYDQDIADPVALAFASDGRYAAAAADGTVRIYAADGQPKATKKLTGTGHPNSIAFSPSGDLLAIGFDGAVRVEVLSGLDLAARVTPDVSGIATGDLANVAFLVDGPTTFLVAGGAINTQDGDAMVYSWADTGLGQRRILTKARNTIMALAANTAGKIAIGTAEPSLLILDHGQTTAAVKSSTIDFRYIARGRLAANLEGTKILFSTDTGRPLEVVDLLTRTVGPYVPEKYPDEKWFDPLTTAKTGHVASWRLSQQTKVLSKPVQFRGAERSQSASVSTDGLIALGTDMRLRLFSAEGAELRERPTTTPVYGVTFSGDGQRLIAAFGDGTLRVYDVRKEGLSPVRLSIFLHNNRQSWVAWTPEGFFDHSEYGGKDMVGYALNRGAGKSPEWLTFSQLYKTLYAPSLVQKRLLADKQGEEEIASRFTALGDIRQQYEKAIPPLVALAEICFDRLGEHICLPPDQIHTVGVKGQASALAAPASPDTAQQSAPITLPADVAKVKLGYVVTSREGGTGNFDLVINDVNKGRSRLPRDSFKEKVERELAIDGDPTTVTARVYDGSDTIFSEAQPLTINNAARTQASAKGDLYVLAAGIDKYPEGGSWFRVKDDYYGYVPLGLARSDAANFARIIKDSTKSLYRDIHPVTLFDDKATTAAIVNALTDIAKRAGPDDTVLVYLSGHGDKVSVGDQKYDFMYVTADADLLTKAEKDKSSSLPVQLTEDETRSRIYQSALKGRDLVQLLSQLKSDNVMVFLDACHAGTVNLFSRDFDAVGSLSAEAGRYILAGAAEDEEEGDSYDGKTGVFATAVLGGLLGQHGIQRDQQGVIDQFTLGLHVQEVLPTFVQNVNLKIKKEQWKLKQNARFRVATRHAIKFPLAMPSTPAK